MVVGKTVLNVAHWVQESVEVMRQQCAPLQVTASFNTGSAGKLAGPCCPFRR